MQYLKIYLPIFFVAYIALAFVVPSYRTYKKTGINPITFGTSDNAQDYIGFVMKLLIALLFAAVLLFSISNKYYNYLVPITYLQNQYTTIMGLIVIHISLIFIVITQHQMSTSWRIGIDETNKTPLVTSGVFAISRNPIFLGMIFTVLGLFLIIPNAITFLTFLTTYFIIQIQIRLEEEFLLRQHQNIYLEYKNKTKRLLLL